MTYPRQDLEADWSFGREGGARARPTDRPTEEVSLLPPSLSGLGHFCHAWHSERGQRRERGGGEEEETKKMDQQR